MASRFRKRKKHMDEVQQELELMPMLNVFISIIPLLLLSAAFVEVAVIPASVTADSGAAAAVAKDEAPFDVAVDVGAKSYVVRANGIETARVPRGGDANTVRASLVEALRKAAAGHPAHREVRILAPATTRYEEIVGVMDASRAAGLPNAALDGDPQGDS